MRVEEQKFENINRNIVINFTFCGIKYSGFYGDTLASALLANGVNNLARSFKYGRIRGIYSAGAEEPNALVSIESGSDYIPNVKATEILIYEGMVANPAHYKNSLNFDLRAFLTPLHRFMPVGFYYKTFMSSQKIWHLYERFLRKFSGFSKAPTDKDNAEYLHRYHEVDVLIVGGGIAGLKYAIENSDADILLIDERNCLGGEIASSGDVDAYDWLDNAKKKLSNMSNISCLLNTCATSWYDDNLILATEDHHQGISINQRKGVRHTVHKIRANKVILATGAHERGLLFDNNDLPNIFLAASASRYLQEFGVLVGKKIVIATNNNSVYDLVDNFKQQGAEVIVVDSRENANADCANQTIIKALGSKKVHSVILANNKRISCDAVLVSGGFSPIVHLDCHTGKRPRFDSSKQMFLPIVDSDSSREYKGALIGDYSWQHIVNDVKDKSLEIKSIEVPSKSAYAFVDLQNDVKVSDIKLAVQEGYQSVEHIKRYTALGFGTDQGKTSNFLGICVAANALNIDINEVGTTTFRPLYKPVAFGAFAGGFNNSLFDVKRYTPMHSSHMENKAEWELVGQWYRPWYFPQNESEDLDASVHRECVSARKSLAMMDASTLGKIDIQGPDARKFLARIYTNAWAKLTPGNCRYGLMCNEQGMIMDDGVTACITDNHFVMTTTTGGAAHIYEFLENWLQTEWTDLKVYLTSVTDHYATTAVVGPKARKLMQKICFDVDFSNDNFAFMQWHNATIGDIDVRIMRISFSGELAYEINVQSQYGKAIWDLVYEQGKEFNITQYGTESMHVLRAEKGYIIVGQDTDGSITPFDSGMNWAVSLKKPFSFIGQRSLSRSDLVREDRKQLVGLKPKDAKYVLAEGCQLVFDKSSNTMVGHVTSSYFSPVLNYSFALAVVKGGLNKMGDTVYSKGLDGRIEACEICSPVFYDSKNNNINGEL